VIRENTNRSRRQTQLSVAILSILVLIATGIVVTQFRYNPAMLEIGEIAPAADSAGHFTPPASIEAFVPLPSGFKPLTAPEIFDVGNLSDKINGKAELYLSAGFIGLVTQRFGDEASPDLWVEAYVYDMGAGRNAFAVFSAQRRENSENLDLAQYAYRSANAVFLVHGRYYLELIASQDSGLMIQSIETLARTFVGNTQTETIVIAEQDLFPSKDLVADSISLIATDAFGFEQLDQVYVAEYQLNGETCMAFISQRRSPPEAIKLASAYAKFLLEFGGQKLDQPFPVENAFIIEILDTYEIIFSYGPYLAGVRESSTPNQAIQLAILLNNKLKEVTGAR
jgi:hypothetical protein